MPPEDKDKQIEELQGQINGLNQKVKNVLEIIEEGVLGQKNYIPQGVGYYTERFRLGVLTRRGVSDSSFTAKLSDVIIGITNSDTTIRVTLPKAKDAGVGKCYIIKDENGEAGTNNITIIGADTTELIDDTTTKVIAANWGVVRLYAGDSDWFTW